MVAGPLAHNPPATRGMHGIAFKLVDLLRLLIDVSQQPARRFAVEANRGDEVVVLLDTPRPRLGIKLSPVVPFLHGRAVRQMAPVAFELITHSEISGKTRMPQNQDGPCVTAFARHATSTQILDPTTTQLFGTLCPAITKHHSKLSNPSKANTAATREAFEPGSPAIKETAAKSHPELCCRSRTNF